MGWEFWIDVGGTFTDCIARRPDGSLATHKLLSNATYQGIVAEGSSASTVRATDRSRDPNGFFDGFELRILGTELRAKVENFDPSSGTFVLSEPLAAQPKVGARYELRSPFEAPVAGVRWLMGKSSREPIGQVVVRLGTTRGTNALLERQGVSTALVTTRGFGDVLRIGYQNRPRLFDLAIRKPEDLYEQSIEVQERIGTDGTVLESINEDDTLAKLRSLREAGIESIAVCLLNAYRNPEHEEKVAALAESLGFRQVSVSTRLSPVQRLVDRAYTTVVDAYLTPIVRDYVRAIAGGMPEADLTLMTSSGALVRAESFGGRESILSGPAGGVVGVSRVAKAAGYDKVIGFDMGGTSTDVCRYAGDYERRYRMEIADPRTGGQLLIVAPMLSIETVAAGGGSICSFDGQKAIVGPRSAGSDPGPACYGKGGPVAVTDINVHMGRILPDQFPFPLDTSAVKERLSETAASIEKATGQAITLDRLAEGFAAIANANMAAAIKKVSIARGVDVRDHALISFGGAGAQHACAIARLLSMKTVILHPYAGILSAFGIGQAQTRVFGVQDIHRSLPDFLAGEAETVFGGLLSQLKTEITAEGIAADQVAEPIRRLDLRYAGQEAAITVPQPADGDYRKAFEVEHERLYGFNFPGREVEVAVARMELSEKERLAASTVEPVTEIPMSTDRHTKALFHGEWVNTAVFEREKIPAGGVVEGPAIILESISTIVIEPGWRAMKTSIGDLVVTASDAKLASSSDLATDDLETADPIKLELFNNQFASIAEQMGITLQKTALSTNVKERLDFSCALFTKTGDLVVNAPHVPVHLGAMGETVRSILREFSSIHPGDVFITNDPFRGGSHLPDVTVVTPIFESNASDSELLFFAASRAHHAEIGGITPGSMPPFSKSLAEEGVLLRPFKLVEQGQSREDRLQDLLESAEYPSRSVEENLADIRAQIAANTTGTRLLQELVKSCGAPVVLAYMGHIQKAAENKMRAALARMEAKEYRFQDALDDGSPIAVSIKVEHDANGGKATVSFEGTGPVVASNLNANPAIVRSATLYVLRCLINEDIPLNDGVLAPITLSVPPGSLLNPVPGDSAEQCPAVGGGNVETSQRVVDVLLGALGLAAASQGTMNNFLFGAAKSSGERAFGYYETISGGAGAGPGFDGASGVHTHMTNTRITDPEILEDRYPMRLREFSLRKGSGGQGKHPGGDGVVREFEFLMPLEVSLVTNRRKTSPYGLSGGESGKPGHNVLITRGEREELPPMVQRRIEAGQILRLETPGGGAFGAV